LKTGETKRNTRYYSFDACVDGKRTPSKVWTIAAKLKDGDVVECDVKEDTYQGKKQFVIDSYTIIEVDKEMSSKLFGIPNVDSRQLFADIMETVDGFSNEKYQDIANNILGAHKEAFMTAPAARGVHQAYEGGLIVHTHNVLKLCKMFAEQYPVDKDLLFCAAILHDIGKIFTYKMEENSIEFTLYGSLFEHLYVGTQLISDMWAGEPCNEKAYLMHCILGHHGKREWGSPVVPKLASAMLLHYADFVDSRMGILDESLKSSNTNGKFTDKVFFLENSEMLKEYI